MENIPFQNMQKYQQFLQHQNNLLIRHTIKQYMAVLFLIPNHNML